MTAYNCQLGLMIEASLETLASDVLWGNFQLSGQLYHMSAATGLSADRLEDDP
jgi:hypothetical protein